MQVALATHTHPDQWWDTDDAVMATVVAELQATAATVKGGRRGR